MRANVLYCKCGRWHVSCCTTLLTHPVEFGGRSVWVSMSFSCPWALADPELEPTSPNGWQPAWTGCKIGLGQARPGTGHGLQAMPNLFWNGQSETIWFPRGVEDNYTGRGDHGILWNHWKSNKQNQDWMNHSILWTGVTNTRARQNLAGENIDENIALRFPIE